MKKHSLLASVAVLSLGGCSSPPPDYSAQYKPLADAYVAGWNEGSFDTFDNMLTADFKRRAPGGAVGNAAGIEAIKTLMTNTRIAYPDVKVVITEGHYLKDVAVLIWTATGTNTGPGADGSPPTGKPITVSGMTLMRYRDGKIAEENVAMDMLDWFQQLGYTVTPPAPAAKP
jgi:steroid delta-isomerase-like uncharacterized protein